MSVKSPADLQPTIDKLNAAVPFNIRAGIEIQYLDKSRVVMHIPHTKENGNHVGAIAAGGVFAVGEFAPGAVIVANFGLEYLVLVTEIKIEFLKSGNGELFAESSLEPAQIQDLRDQIAANRKGRIRATTTIKKKDGTLISQMSGEYYVRKAAWTKERLGKLL